MKELSQQIQNIISDELSNINQKIKGTSFLEILKYKILEKIANEETKNKIIENVDTKNITEEFKFDDFEKNILVKLTLFKSPSIQLNTKLNENLLLICLKNSVKIGLENSNNKKVININLIQNTGITLSTGSVCSLNFNKDSIILEIYLEDDKNDIEN